MLHRVYKRPKRGEGVARRRARGALLRRARRLVRRLGRKGNVPRQVPGLNIRTPCIRCRADIVFAPSPFNWTDFRLTTCPACGADNAKVIAAVLLLARRRLCWCGLPFEGHHRAEIDDKRRHGAFLFKGGYVTDEVRAAITKGSP